MISRVADHCFWFGRYLERAESTARLLSVTLGLAPDAGLAPSQCWLPVVIVSGEEERFVARFGEAARGDGEAVQEYMSWDEDNFCSIRRSVSAARENARAVREVVSLAVWEAVNELHLWLGDAAARTAFIEDRDGFYRRVRNSTQLCLGFMRSTMLHDTSLDFIWLGVMLERVGQTARTLDVQHHTLTTLAAAGGVSDGGAEVVEVALWLALLRACSGLEPFMKRNQGRVSGHAVAAFLVGEPRFPRSVRYCVHAAFDRLAGIRPDDDPALDHLPGARAQERLRALDHRVAGTDPAALDNASLHALLTHVVDEIGAIGEIIGEELLGYAPVAQAGGVGQ